MSDSNDKLQLAEGERILFEEPATAGKMLVHDGNSRWKRVGDTLYFIVNEAYEAPEE